MLSFSLKGQGNACKMKIEPPISCFEGDTFINYAYSNKIVFNKISDGNLKYKVRLEGKNDPDLKVDLRVESGLSILEAPEGVLEGVIPEEQRHLEFYITLESPNCGEKNAYFFVQIEDGEPLTF